MVLPKAYYIGRVCSTALPKTIGVACQNYQFNGHFQHVFSYKKRYFAHDEKEEANVGDTVLISMALSRDSKMDFNKKYELIKILDKDISSSGRNVSMKSIRFKSLRKGRMRNS